MRRLINVLTILLLLVWLVGSGCAQKEPANSQCIIQFYKWDSWNIVRPEQFVAPDSGAQSKAELERRLMNMAGVKDTVVVILDKRLPINFTGEDNRTVYATQKAELTTLLRRCGFTSVEIKLATSDTD